MPQQGVEPWPLANQVSIILLDFRGHTDCCHIHPSKEKGCAHAFRAWNSVTQQGVEPWPLAERHPARLLKTLIAVTLFLYD